MGQSRELKFSLIGLGRWGRNYLNYFRGSQLQLRGLCSLSHSRISELGIDSKSFPQSYWSNDYRQVCSRRDSDVVIVATPPETHYEIVKCALENGKHVICEKPFVLEVEQAYELKELSERNNLSLVIDFTQLWQPKTKKLLASIKNQDFPLFINSTTINNGPIRKSPEVIFDWGSHDVSFILSLIKSELIGIEILSQKSNNENKDSYGIVLKFDDSSIGVVVNSNVALTRKKSWTVVTQNGIFAFEDNFTDNPLGNMLDSFIQKVFYHKERVTNIDLAIRVTDTLSTIKKLKK